MAQAGEVPPLRLGNTGTDAGPEVGATRAPSGAEAHDLAMLVQKARVFGKQNRVGLAPLFTIIDHQRKRLSIDALSRGEQLYRAKPDDWARQLEHYWSRWRRAV